MKSLQVSFLIVFLAAFSCNKDRNTPYSHSEYFDNIFKEAESISHLKPEHTFAFLDSAFNAFPHPGIKDLYKKYSFKINVLIDNSSIDTKSMLYVDSMFWILGDHINEKGFIEDYANAFLKKSHVLMWKKDYAGAFECSNKARLAIEQTKDSCLLSSYTFMLAGVSYRQGKDPDAIKYNLEALREMNPCPDDYRKFKIKQAKLDDIAISYHRHGMDDSALYYYNMDLNFLEESKKKFPDIDYNKKFSEEAKGVVAGNMGDVYLKKGDSAAAEAYYRMDTNMYAGFDHGDGQCTELKLVNLYLAENRLNKAGEMLTQLKNSLDSFANCDNQQKWYRLQLEYLDKTGQTKEEYKYIKPYILLKDSIERSWKVPQVNMEQEYEHVKDVTNLTLLEKQNELKNKYIIVVLTCSLLAIAIAILLWINWKRSNKFNDKIRRQNSELRLAMNSLSESQKENTQLMQIVAHDLKNPIASMISITSLLLENSKLEDDDREMLELMQTSSYNAIEMISDVLNLNTTTEDMKKSAIDIHVLLQYCVDLLQFRASEKNQQITLETVHASIMLNREKMWRVVSNLIVNAIKFSASGKEILVKGYKKEHDFIIMVQDQGIGIPDNFKTRIFDMFSIAKRPGTSGERSYGLGLAISRQIIEAHGGKIWFESEVGVGTKFFVSVPME